MLPSAATIRGALHGRVDLVAPRPRGGRWHRRADHAPLATLSRIAAVAMLLIAGSATGAEPETYALDPVHTRVMLAVDHAGFSKAIGTVSGSTGTLRFDPGDWTTATLQAEVPLARLDFGDAKWNTATLANNLLDADDHPVARFVSTRIEPVDAQRAAVYGDLTLRGVTREVKLDVVLNAAKRHPLPPFRRTIGFSATTALSRAEFGITAWKSVIGDRVELRIEAEATRTRGGADDDEAPASDQTTQDPSAMDAPAAEPALADPAIEPAAPPDDDAAIDPAAAPDPVSPPPEPPPATDPTP